ncbi:MAG: glycosyltransferase family 39 protein, partial [Candidatus Omnitrophica bacterium]|nr:glycosyltransferase family 39 protein [Candidatus Omnitrophota bacterium]
WAPFYIYAKVIYFFADKLNLSNLGYFEFEKVAKCLMSFSTVVFTILTLIFTYFIVRKFFSYKITILSILVVFFGTPIFYYSLFNVANANIVATLLSVILILFYLQIMDKGKIPWLVCGLFFSICIAVKVDLWFHSLFIFSFFIYHVIGRRISWVKGIFFLIGIVPGIALKTINDYIKYGNLHIGEVCTLNLKGNYLLDQLFSSYRGFFYTSPVFYICLAGICLILLDYLKKNKNNYSSFKNVNIVALFLCLYVLIKIIVLGWRYAWGGGTCGARPLLTEFPVFVLLYAIVSQIQKKRLTNIIFYGISIICIFWNFLIISEYMSGKDLIYVSGFPPIIQRFSNIKYVLMPLFQLKEIGLKLKICIPLIIAVGLIILFILKILGNLKVWGKLKNFKSQNDSLRFYYLFTVYLSVGYMIVTGLNVFNNRINVRNMKNAGFFNNHKVISSYEFGKVENLGSINEMIFYFTLRGDEDRVNKLKKQKIEIYGAEIL